MTDKFRFAKLISYITSLSKDCLTEFQISELDALIIDDSPLAHAGSVNALLECMKLGKKIEAIKEYRSLTRMSLKDSKDAVEAHWAYPANQHPLTAA